MKEYIERSKEFMQGVIDCCSPHTPTAIKVKLYLEQQPAADVVERKRGEWGKVYRSKVTVNDGYVSTCCDMWNERKSNFCPNCGADMRSHQNILCDQRGD